MAYLKELVNKPMSGEWGSDGEGIKVLRTTNFTNRGVINFKNVVTRNVSTKIIEQKKLQKGDIIIEKSGGSPTQPVGRVVYFDVDGEFICNNFTSILRPKREKVFPKYLHHILFANHKFGVTKLFQNKTTGIINLQLTRYLEKLSIALPNIQIQKKIAQNLDDAAALCDKTEELIKKYDGLAESLFLELMNLSKGEKVSLSSVAKINPKKSEINKISKETTITFLPMANVSERGDINKSLEKRISEVWSGFTYFSEGDVLFAKITPCMENGKGGIVRGLKNNIGFGSTEFHVLRPVKNISNSEWLYYLLNSTKFRKIAESNMRGSAGQKRVTTDFFDRFTVNLPTIEHQNVFAEKIAFIELQKELAKQELKESEDLFNCLLQKAFKGELV